MGVELASELIESYFNSLANKSNSFAQPQPTAGGIQTSLSEKHSRRQRKLSSIVSRTQKLTSAKK